MFCSYCGNNLNQNVKFCSYCGKELSPSLEVKSPESILKTVENSRPSPVIAVASKDPKPDIKTGRSLLFGLIGLVLGATILAAVFIFSGVASFGDDTTNDVADKVEGPGYDTPEEAAEAYLEALRDQDIDAMMAVFAIESCGNNYDLEEFCTRINSYSPYMDMKYPNTNEYNINMNIETRKASIINQISEQYRLYNMPSVDPSLTMSPYTSEINTAIEKDLENYVFDDLRITGTVSPDELTHDLYGSEKSQENLLKQVKPYGVRDLEDVANVVVTFEADGDTWYFCPQLVRYDGKWYIQQSLGYVAQILGFYVNSGGIVRESMID